MDPPSSGAVLKKTWEFHTAYRYTLKDREGNKSWNDLFVLVEPPASAGRVQ